MHSVGGCAGGVCNSESENKDTKVYEAHGSKVGGLIGNLAKEEAYHKLEQRGKRLCLRGPDLI